MGSRMGEKKNDFIVWTDNPSNQACQDLKEWPNWFWRTFGMAKTHFRLASQEFISNMQIE